MYSKGLSIVIGIKGSLYFVCHVIYHLEWTPRPNTPKEESVHFYADLLQAENRYAFVDPVSSPVVLCVFGWLLASSDLRVARTMAVHNSLPN